MNNQLEIVKNVSVLIEERKFNQAKIILLDFIDKNKNIKLDIKFYYTLYLVFHGLKFLLKFKKIFRKVFKN